MSDRPKTVLDLFRLDGRRALVTGGSKGLGRAIAQALAEAGAEPVLVSRTQAECDAAADAIRAATGRPARGIAADVTVAADVDRLAEAVGPIDVLVNSAGLNVRGPVESLSEADWEAVMGVNLKAPFLLARRFGPGMAARGWGRIVNLGSILSAIGIAGRTPYASSKAGILGLTRVLALEWAGKGVTVNALCPGPFATDMNKPLLNDPAQYAAFVANVPMGRWGELHEVTAAALFLASDASSFMTGAALYLDGGWTAR